MIVNNFNHNNQLFRCDVLFPVADRFTFYSESLQCGSMIDYFLTSNCNDTVGFNIVDLNINLSDHRPIMAVCGYSDNVSKSVPVTGHCCQSSTAHSAWSESALVPKCPDTSALVYEK